MGAAEVAGLALLLVALVLGVLAVLALRRVREVRRGGIEVAMQLRPAAGARGWRLGVGRYRGDEFGWYRVSSLRSGPDRVFHRASVTVLEQRDPSPPESYAVPAGSVVLRCEIRSGPSTGQLEVAMGRDTLTGFLSWLESAPPGRRQRC